jgi:hypothetical protein
MSGIELATFFEREIPACKVLLFSGRLEAQQMIMQAREAGHRFSFLQKPIHHTELVAARNL